MTVRFLVRPRPTLGCAAYGWRPRVHGVWHGRHEQRPGFAAGRICAGLMRRASRGDTTSSLEQRGRTSGLETLRLRMRTHPFQELFPPRSASRDHSYLSNEAPPSTSRVAPVIDPASSEQRYAAALAICSAVCNLPRGRPFVAFRAYAGSTSICLQAMPAFTMPGARMFPLI
jgi:hypothetical protein